ncbi:MAG: N-acetyltransferase [Bacteroidaceae bacterium]|nr:N-acetyltransferase [Bacteroidaceae bacterium]
MKEPIIDIRRADDTSALLHFRCGVKSMDDFIHDKQNGLAKFIKLRLSNLWIAYEEEKAVAFFALSKDAIMLNNEDRQNIERTSNLAERLASSEDADKFWNKEKYPAVEIDYLAVCEEKRNEPGEHLGTAIVEKIAQYAAQDKFSATLFLTVEALDTREYSAVNFYRRCDFRFSEVAQNRYNYDMMYGNQPTTRRMYKIIIPIEDD